MLFPDFRRDGVTGSAGAVLRALGLILAERIASLDHKAGNDSVEGGAVVKALFHELFKILGMFGGGHGVEFDHDDALRGGEGDDFFFHNHGFVFHVGGVLGLVGFFFLRGGGEKGEAEDRQEKKEFFKHVEQWSKLLLRPTLNFPDRHGCVGSWRGLRLPQGRDW